MELINMKKIIIFAVFISSFLTPVHASVEPVIAVIDTGTNPALFKTNIITEYCVVESFNCPNGKKNMEGIGASQLPPTTVKSLDHGTQMLSVIQQINPKAKVIPIRIVGVQTSTGLPGAYTNDSVKSALDWVIANRIKYNITVVSISQGAIFPNCRVPSGMLQQVSALKAVNVPVIASSGNDGNKNAINSPACIPDVVAIGATDNPASGTNGSTWDSNADPYIARYSNVSPAVDFYTNARYMTTTLNGNQKFLVGTSTATAAFAAWWQLNDKGSFDSTYSYFVSISSNAKNEYTSGRYIEIK